jgi:hypothetical protein
MLYLWMYESLAGQDWSTSFIEREVRYKHAVEIPIKDRELMRVVTLRVVLSFSLIAILCSEVVSCLMLERVGDKMVRMNCATKGRQRDLYYLA